MVEQRRSLIEYEAPSVVDLGTLADLTAGASHTPPFSDLPGNDSNGKSA
jgi:hypothetical protein